MLGHRWCPFDDAPRRNRIIIIIVVIVVVQVRCCILGIVSFLDIDKAMLWIVPVRNGEKVIQVLRDARLPAARGLEDGDKDELLRRDLDRGAGKDAPCAEELERLDLDGVRGAVEVTGNDKVGDLGAQGAPARRCCAPGCERALLSSLRRKVGAAGTARVAVAMAGGCRRRRRWWWR